MQASAGISLKSGGVGYYGKKNNNLIMRSVHGAGIFKDDVEEDPNRRYKMLCQGLQVGFSSNGINGRLRKKLIANCRAIRITTLFGPAHFKKYVGFTRDWHKIDRGFEGAETKTNHRWCRRVAPYRKRGLPALVEAKKHSRRRLLGIAALCHDGLPLR